MLATIAMHTFRRCRCVLLRFLMSLFAAQKVRCGTPQEPSRPLIAGEANRAVHDRLCRPDAFTGVAAYKLKRATAAAASSGPCQLSIPMCVLT